MMVIRLSRRGAQEPTLQWSRRHRRAARTLPRQRLPPNRQPTKIHHLCRALLTAARRRRRLPAENIVSARVLLRCHCAATSDSLRCDARSMRRAAGTRAPPHLTCASHACAHFGYAPRVADRRRRCGCCKQALGVVAPACARVRVSQGPPLPRPVFRYTTERAGCLGGRRASTGRLRGVATLSRAPCRPEAQQSPLGTAERRPCGAL